MCDLNFGHVFVVLSKLLTDLLSKLPFDLVAILAPRGWQAGLPPKNHDNTCLEPPCSAQEDGATQTSKN
jgi:hypothetical protein